MLNVAGLVLDIVGAFILMWGELHQNAAFLKYQGKGEGLTWFDSQVKKLTWWKQWPGALKYQVHHFWETMLPGK